jgi:DNA-binding transcriptional regulator LsrR (DeoR family)
MTNPLRDGIGRVDGRLLLRALSYIAKHGSATTEEVAKHLKVSAFTVQRLFRHSRKQFGVKITYRKTNQPYLGAGEFTVEDWGVFDRNRVRRFIQTRERR